MIKIDGKGIAQKTLAYIEKEHKLLKDKYGRAAGLAVIMAGDNPASEIYVKNKIKACETAGIYSRTIKLDENVTEKDLIEEMKKSNPNVDKNIFMSAQNVYTDCILGNNLDGKSHSYLENY